MRFRKKPVEVEAWQFNGENGMHWPQWMHDYECEGKVCHWEDSNTIWIPLLEGFMAASLGDWIIKGVKGELYPCKPDIFELIYEKID